MTWSAAWCTRCSRSRRLFIVDIMTDIFSCYLNELAIYVYAYNTSCSKITTNLRKERYYIIIYYFTSKHLNSFSVRPEHFNMLTILTDRLMCPTLHPMSKTSRSLKRSGYSAKHFKRRSGSLPEFRYP